MAALAANTPRRHRSAGVQVQKSYIVADAVQIWMGSWVGVYTTGANEGYLGPWSVVTGSSMNFLGMATKNVLGDTGAAEPPMCPVNCGGIELIGVAVAGATLQTQVGVDKVYLLNDNDLSLSAPAAGGVVAKIVKKYPGASIFDVRFLSAEAYQAQADV